MVVVYFETNSRLFFLSEKRSETDALFRKFLTTVFVGRHDMGISLYRGPYSTEANLVFGGEASIPGTLKDG